MDYKILKIIDFYKILMLYQYPLLSYENLSQNLNMTQLKGFFL